MRPALLLLLRVLLLGTLRPACALVVSTAPQHAAPTGVAVLLKTPQDNHMDALKLAVAVRELDVVVAEASDASSGAAEAALDEAIASLPADHAVLAVFESPSTAAAMPPEAAMAMAAINASEGVAEMVRMRPVFS